MDIIESLLLFTCTTTPANGLDAICSNSTKSCCFFNNKKKLLLIINDDNEFWWYDHWLKPTGRETLTVHVFKIENTEELRQNWLETLSSASAPKTLDNQKKKSKINRSSSSSSRTQSQSQSSSRSRTNRNSKSQKQEKDIATVVNRLQPQIREIGPFVFRYV